MIGTFEPLLNSEGAADCSSGQKAPQCVFLVKSSHLIPAKSATPLEIEIGHHRHENRTGTRFQRGPHGRKSA
jgi:hypothetical protein